MSIFQKRLKEIRKLKGYTQKKTAEGIGISEQAYQVYEYGKREPSIGKLDKLCQFFDVPADYLLGNGLFVNFDHIIEIREDLVTEIEKLFGRPSPFFRGTTITDPNGKEIFIKLSDIDFVAALSVVLRSIDFTFNADGEIEDIHLNFKE